MSVTVAYLTFPEFTSLDRTQRSDRLGGLVTITAWQRSAAFIPRTRGLDGPARWSV